MVNKKGEGASTTWKQKLGLSTNELPRFDGRADDLVILVMGPTGVGKSTFIKEYTGDTSVTVGHQLQSCTRDVTWYDAGIPSRFTQLGKRRLILVDTPGFDDTFSDDSEILRRVSAWLAQSYNDDTPVAGIVYMNDITQKRMFGSTRMNLKMFTKLCGEKSFRKVVMATSQWDNLPDDATGAKREQELKNSFWEHVVKGGAKIMRIKDKPADQEAIINYLLDNCVRGHLEQEFLQIQREVVDLQKAIPATQAGQELKYTLEELLKLQKANMSNTLDERGKQDMVKKQALLKEQIQALKLSLGDRFKKFFGLL